LPVLVEQMSRILDYVAQLSAATGSNGVKAFLPGPDAIRFRPDEVTPSLPPEELLANAPAAEAQMFRVPPVLE